MLNTLANEGRINESGMNLTAAQLTDAMVDTLNIDRNVAGFLSNSAVNSIGVENEVGEKVLRGLSDLTDSVIYTLSLISA